MMFKKVFLIFCFLYNNKKSGHDDTEINKKDRNKENYFNEQMFHWNRWFFYGFQSYSVFLGIRLMYWDDYFLVFFDNKHQILKQLGP